jgi:hypothetical protein
MPSRGPVPDSTSNFKLVPEPFQIVTSSEVRAEVGSPIGMSETNTLIVSANTAKVVLGSSGPLLVQRCRGVNELVFQSLQVLVLMYPLSSFVIYIATS